MRTDDFCPVGRGQEWTTLLAPVQSHRSGLLVVAGLPGSGRSHLLGRLGQHAVGVGYNVLGADNPLSLDPTTRLEDLRRALSAVAESEPGDTSTVAKASPPPGLARVLQWISETGEGRDEILDLLKSMSPVLILVDGFLPGPALRVWLLSRLIPAIRRSRQTIVLAVSGTPEHVKELLPYAAGAVQLGELNRNEVRDHLFHITRDQQPPLEAQEMETYVAASVADPSVLAAFSAVFSACSSSTTIVE